MFIIYHVKTLSKLYLTQIFHWRPLKNVISKEREPAPDVISKERERLRNPKIPHYIWDMDFSLRKISHPAHAGIRNDRKEGRNDKKRRVQGVEDSEKRRVQGVEDSEKRRVQGVEDSRIQVEKTKRGKKDSYTSNLLTLQPSTLRPIYASKLLKRQLFGDDRKEGQNDKNGGYSKVSYDKNERDVLITRAHIVHGYTLEEIADFLHFHYVAVSMAIKRIGTDNV